VIYVRGFAGSTPGIDAAVDDPFYGFNNGSTHVRVGRDQDPVFYQFESPLMRLLIDHDYELRGGGLGGQVAWLEKQDDGAVEESTIWIHRFYDVSASTFGLRPEDYRIERAAEDLLTLITLVRTKTGAPRVHLVAHSMGGLVCRCLIQKIIPERRHLPGRTQSAADVVQTLFTYATPHGGIEFAVGFGLFERLRDTFGLAGGDIFGPERMWQYLNPDAEHTRPPDGWQPEVMPDDAFPKDRIFCLVGTNPGDYAAALGLSSKAVGVRSDGLVQIRNAAVPGARSAFVHRSHSGRYGIVNSEEGYQNLRRFLLGDLEVHADLVRLDQPGDPDVVRQVEAELSVRGLPVLMHEKVAEHHCPIELTRDDDIVELGTTYLLADPSARPVVPGSGGQRSASARYTLHLRVLSLRESGGIFNFGQHLEKSPDFDDHLVVDVGAWQGGLAAWAEWGSQIPSRLSDYEPSGEPRTDDIPAQGVWQTTIALPPGGAFLGDGTAVRLTVRDRSGEAAEQLAET
jgi:pimeloyl-ACP methyl ester carboxylesterase